MKHYQDPMSLKRILTTDNLDTPETPARKQHKVTAQHCSRLQAFGPTTSTTSRDKQYDNSAQTIDTVEYANPAETYNAVNQYPPHAYPSQTLDVRCSVEMLPPNTAGVSSGASNIGGSPSKRDKKFIVVNPGDYNTPNNEYQPVCGTCGRDDLIWDDLNRHQESPYCMNERTFKLAYAKAVLNYGYDQLPAVLARFDKERGQTAQYYRSDLDEVISLLEGGRGRSWVRWFSTLPRLTKLCHDLDNYFHWYPYPPAYSIPYQKPKPPPHHILRENPNLTYPLDYPSTYPRPCLPSRAPAYALEITAAGTSSARSNHKNCSRSCYESHVVAGQALSGT
ncbi:hypothetical protein G6011_09547 [Alternaria panax]|uniref:Uncharacterized protein n=1 Tax=Alternaria panax TaxID=48097 RepID=A0AAD4FF72_9PLEO|nr:hypothetical protein G6011_09547 [Alternaria panax]